MDKIASRNVLRTVEEICKQSDAIRKFVGEGSVRVAGAMYDVKTGLIENLAGGTET